MLNVSIYNFSHLNGRFDNRAYGIILDTMHAYAWDHFDKDNVYAA